LLLIKQNVKRKNIRHQNETTIIKAISAPENIKNIKH
jgi:hypothetical protein